MLATTSDGVLGVEVWSNCKLGVKLQAAFALVMLVFVAALVGTFVVDAKVSALTAVQTTLLVPARAAANRLELAASQADDIGGYYVTERRPAQAAVRLAQYRSSVASYQTQLAVLPNSQMTMRNGH